MNNFNKRKWYTIVKYSPENYKNGIYTKEEWTSIYDINRTFDGRKLYLKEYLDTEARYADTIVDIMMHLGIGEVILQSSFKATSYIKLPFSNLPFNGSIDFINHTKARSVIDIGNVPALVKLSLREWGYFPFYNAEQDFAVDFGYDLYMYIHTLLDIEELEKIVGVNHLYLNPR